MTMRGICSVCERAVKIDPSTLARQEELDRGVESWAIDMQYGDSINYVVVDHELCGELCDGSGQIPQVVLGK